MDKQARLMQTSAEPGVMLNEDNSHFYFTRAGQELDEEKVAAWVDQYAGTQVRELLMCPNCMRTSYASEVWDPIWLGYDPQGSDDQPLLASTAPASREVARGWIDTAWKLHLAGIDPYAVWIDRCRKVGISPWLSMRMNDVHDVDNETSYLHSKFWRTHPEFRRDPNKFTVWMDRALDFGRHEVREYSISLVRELAHRYDFDGLELDWMRFGFHFRPGHEAEGARLLTRFVREAREVLDSAEKLRGHRIMLSARVPSRPQTAVGLGMDAVTWAKEGLVDWIVITPFWASIETDMPVELWKQLLSGTRTKLATGLEVLLRPYRQYCNPFYNSVETVRGAATSMLSRGADRIYLFNYMDCNPTEQVDAEHREIVQEVGSLETMKGKRRRHVVTYADTWAPGEPVAKLLPSTSGPGDWRAFRVHTGPKPTCGVVKAIIGLESGAPLESGAVRLHVNCELCRFEGLAELASAVPECPLYAFDVPLSAMNDGYNLIELTPSKQITIGWVEFCIDPRGR